MLTRKQHELIRSSSQAGGNRRFTQLRGNEGSAGSEIEIGVHRLISALEERGFIRRLPNRARALEILRQPEDVTGGAKMPAATPAPAARQPALPLPCARWCLRARRMMWWKPLHGRIAAGVPIEALEGQTSLPVPAALLGAGEHYALEVSGDLMVEAGILDGDLALIRKTEVARDGEIVVALVRGEEATLKYLRRERA
jgi:repressor LexA